MNLNELPLSLTYDNIGILNRRKSKVSSRQDPNTTIQHHKFTLSFPLVASPMDTVCNGQMAGTLAAEGMAGIIHRFQTIEQQVTELRRAVVMNKSGLKVGAIGVAVGVAGDYKARVQALINTYEEYKDYKLPPLWVCFDTANGFTDYMARALYDFQANYGFGNYVIMAGNVATKEGYKFLAEQGVDIVRVGISNGSACTTGLVTGVGQGIVSAIDECNQTRQVVRRKSAQHIARSLYMESRAPLILADGGIKHSADIAKALAVGADMVMLGSLLAGFDESPGELLGVDSKYLDYEGEKRLVKSNFGYDEDEEFEPQHKQLWERYKKQLEEDYEQYKLRKGYKVFRGMASHTAAQIQNNLNSTTKEIVPEGVEAKVPYKGKVNKFLRILAGGVRSTMSYVDALNIAQYKDYFERHQGLVRLTSESFKGHTPFIKENGVE